MYQVFARKYRPQTFGELVNQEHVKTTLANAIAQNRIAHGYIFSGQRGTGKTTVARIVARCLNCVNGPTAGPCGQCSGCREIAGGNAVDVIEIDAASNRGINEMRELRENVRYRPARDRYKIFIIDEAHQITSEAFNALLKTLEEPPEWVVFILCTTEAHKIPATIASRCQHFSFRSVDFEELIERLRWICELEKIEADGEVLAVLAQAGEGSVRDSLSALDQAIACCGSTLSAAEIRSMLGIFPLEKLHTVTEALGKGDARRMLEIVDGLERNGENLQHFCRELSRYLRNLLVSKVVGRETRFIAASAEERRRLNEIAAAFSEEDLTRYLQLCLDLFRDLQYSLQPRLHLEIGLLRMVHAGRLLPIEEALASLSGPSGSPPASAPPGSTQGSSRSGTLSPAPVASAAPAGAVSATVPRRAANGEDDGGWKEKLCAALVQLGLQFTADAVAHSRIEAREGELVFVTPQDLLLAMNSQDIQQALRRTGAGAMRVMIRAGGAVESSGAARPVAETKAESEDELSQRALQDPEVRRFRELFPGQVRAVRDLRE